MCWGDTGVGGTGGKRCGLPSAEALRAHPQISTIGITATKADVPVIASTATRSGTKRSGQFYRGTPRNGGDDEEAYDIIKLTTRRVGSRSVTVHPFDGILDRFFRIPH